LLREVFKESKRPIHVARVKDGDEALDYLNREGRFVKAERPDLVLLDLNMPKKSGLEVLDQIKKDPALQAIPVIVLTNSRQESDVRRAYDHHANFFISKPADLQELYLAMRYVENVWLGSVLEEAQ